jgi:CheY-like chemotaxis protein
MMPDVNGFDVAAALRQDPTTMRIPIMVISVVHDEGRARSVGVDSYLTKPIDGPDLIAHVEALLAHGGRHRTVLVADPDAAMREKLHGVLTGQGWTVAAAPDSSTALTMARDRPPDVLLARANPAAPAHLVDALRSDPATQSVVVVLYE